jgi:hypothetical protein
MLMFLMSLATTGFLSAQVHLLSPQVLHQYNTYGQPIEVQSLKSQKDEVSGQAGARREPCSVSDKKCAGSTGKAAQDKIVKDVRSSN